MSGRESQSVGRALEGMAKRKLEALEHLGVVVYFEHAQPGWTKGKRWNPQLQRQVDEWFRSEQAGADYHGVLRSGRAFGLECKTIAPGDRFYQRDLKRKDGKWKRQVVHLEAIARAGCPALVLFWFRPDDFAPPASGLYVVPYTKIPWRLNRSAYSISPEDLAGFEAHQLLLEPYLQPNEFAA